MVYSEQTKNAPQKECWQNKNSFPTQKETARYHKPEAKEIYNEIRHPSFLKRKLLESFEPLLTIHIMFTLCHTDICSDYTMHAYSNKVKM